MATPQPDITHLSDDQRQALQQYIAVTDQDVPAAISLLQRSQWNVQIAIAKFFDGDGPDPVSEALASQNQPQRHVRHENLQESLLYNGNSRWPVRPGQTALDPAPRVVDQPDSEAIHLPNFIVRLILSPLQLLFRPLSLLYKILARTLSYFSFLHPLIPQSLRSNTPSAIRRSNTTGRRSLKAADSAARLKRELGEEYGENSLPFYEGGYAQALDLAKKDLRFLVVVLVSPEHDDTTSFIRETLLSSNVQAFVNDPANEVILWVGDVRDSEAYQVSTALTCNKFPFTALVAHTPQISSTAMSVIARLTGPMSSSTYIAKLQSAITTHSSQLSTLRAARSAQNFERNLRQEQDSAFERSLAQDRERARLRREAEADAAAKVAREREDAQKTAALASSKRQWRQWRAKSIRPEPAPDASDVVRIAIKMPEAARITRRFAADATLDELYAVVECYELIKDGNVATEVSKPEDYEHVFDFRLVSTLPRVVYKPEKVGLIRERVGRNGNLIVESLHPEHEDKVE